MHQIEVDGQVVYVVRKKIKNLHLAVYPPDGRIRVACPLLLDDEAVRLAVLSRHAWIKRQQEKFSRQERQTAREYITGESHFFQGARYRLNVVIADAPPRVSIRNKKILDLYIRPNTSALQRARILSAWYRSYLKETIPLLVAKWEILIGVHVAECEIKHMKTKWGTCNIEAARIWLNLELAKKSPRCLEYIVVHEMVHLLERLHNDRFRSLMNQYLPQWQLIRDELNREPLAHADWEY